MSCSDRVDRNILPILTYDVETSAVFFAALFGQFTLFEVDLSRLAKGDALVIFDAIKSSIGHVLKGAQKLVGPFSGCLNVRSL